VPLVEMLTRVVVGFALVLVVPDWIMSPIGTRQPARTARSRRWFLMLRLLIRLL
jgi:hypothetical protein